MRFGATSNFLAVADTFLHISTVSFAPRENAEFRLPHVRWALCSPAAEGPTEVVFVAPRQLKKRNEDRREMTVHDFPRT
jgi:hypothetical protein